MNIVAWADGAVWIRSVHALFFLPFYSPQYLPRAFKASCDVWHSADGKGPSDQVWGPEIPIQEIILCLCWQGHLSCSKGCCVPSVSCGCGKGQELLLSTTPGWNRMMQINLQVWKKEREERGFFWYKKGAGGGSLDLLQNSHILNFHPAPSRNFISSWLLGFFVIAK